MGRPGFDSWVGKIPEEGKGYPLQYSGLENSLDYIVHWVAKSRTRLSDFRFTSLLLKVVSLIAQLVKNPPAMQETLVQFPGWEGPLEKG